MSEEVSNIEAAIACARIPNDEVSPDTKHQAEVHVIQMQRTNDGIMWFMSHFGEFQHPSTFEFAFVCIAYRLCNHFDEIPPELLGALNEFLFGFVMQRYDSFAEDIQLALASAQAYFVLRVFPTVGDIFQMRVFTMPPMAIVRFLSDYCSLLVIPRPMEVENSAQIKAALTAAGLIPTFLGILNQAITSGVGPAFSALAFFTRWGPLEWLQNGEFIAAILSKACDPGCAIGVLEIFGAIVTRSMPLEVKAMLINGMGMIPKLMEIVQMGPEAKPILIKAAEITDRIGLTFIAHPELFQPVLAVAVELFKIPDVEISSGVMSLMHVMAAKHDDVPGLTKVVFDRITTLYQEDPLQFQENCAMMDCAGILRALCTPAAVAKGVRQAVPRRSDAVVAVIESEASQINLADPEVNIANASAVIYCFGELVASARNIPIVFPNFLAIWQMYSSTFGVETFNGAQWYIIYGFLKTSMQITEQQFPQLRQFISNYYETIVRFVMMPGLPDKMRESFLRLFERFAMKWATKMHTTPEMIFGLLQTPDKHIWMTAGALMNGMVGEVRAAVLNEVIQKVVESGQDSVDAVLAMLVFMRNIAEVPDDAKGVFVAGLTWAFNLVANDDICCELLHCTFCLRELGFQYFCPIIEHVADLRGLEALAEVATKYKMLVDRHQSDPEKTAVVPEMLNPEWVVVTVMKLMSQITERYKFAELCTTQEKTSSCLRGAYSFITRVLPLLPAELVVNINQYTQNVLVTMYKKSSVFASVIMYVKAFAMCDPATAANEFTGSTMNFMFDPDANPYNKNRIVTRPLLEFHTVFKGGKMYQLFTQKLRETLTMFGASEEFIDRYVHLLEGDPRMVLKEGEIMLMELVLTKNGLSWG